MYYPEETVAQVIASNDIVDIIGSYVHLKKSGASYMGLCPFHNEKTPSFSVHPGKQVFHCFGCGEGGNVLTFLMKYENDSFQEALKILADRAGIKLPEENYSAQARQQNEQRAQLLAINKEAATYYYKLLRAQKGARGMDYFIRRELSAKTMQDFGLGYADGTASDMVAHLRSKGFSDENILLSGIAAYDEKRGLHDKFWNRVMFPIMDVSNRVIGFGGRVMGEGKPKYLNSPETPVFDKSRNLYGLNIAKRSKSGYFILCEGYMDVIAMHQAGFTQAVASLGTSFTEGQAAVLKRYVKQVLLSYDSDGAGVKAALRNIGILREAGLNGKVVNLEPYKDPDEFIRSLGPEEFQKRLESAENAFFYQIRQLEKEYRMDDPAARSEFYHEIARRLCGFTDEIERDSYIKAMAQRYYIDESMLRREVISYGRILTDGQIGTVGANEGSGVRRNEEYSRSGGDGRGFEWASAADVRSMPGGEGVSSQGNSGEQRKENRMPVQDRARLRNERLLLTWISDDPGLYVQLREYISAEDFSPGVSRTAAAKYFELLEKAAGDKLAVASGNGRWPGVSPGTVVGMFEDEEEQRQAALLFETRLSGITAQELEKALRDVLCSIKRSAIADLSGNIDSPNALQKLVEVKRELGKLQNLPLVLNASNESDE
jgi:DNA primase